MPRGQQNSALPGNYVICRNCGWIAYPLTRDLAEVALKRFNAYYDSMSKEAQECYGGKRSSIRDYEHCTRCGACYHSFRVVKRGETIKGSTVSPIIWEEGKCKCSKKR